VGADWLAIVARHAQEAVMFIHFPDGDVVSFDEIIDDFIMIINNIEFWAECGELVHFDVHALLA